MANLLTQTVPGSGTTYRVGNRNYIVYETPLGDPPVPLAYEVKDSDQWQRATGTDDMESEIDRTMSTDEWESMGPVIAGDVTDLAISGEDPWEDLVTRYEEEAELKPWLKRPEFIELMGESYLEGRTPSQTEIQLTDWYKNLKQPQRQWAQLVNTDPETAKQQRESQRLNTELMMEKAGLEDPPEPMVNLIADRRTTGGYTKQQHAAQIQALADPYSDIQLDPDIKKAAQDYSFETTREGERKVEKKVNQWLGPYHANQWSEQRIADWAGKIRNNPNAEQELTDHLKGQRQALFPEYENPELTYEDIAPAWRNIWKSTMGTQPDEQDPLFLDIMNSGDYSGAKQRLRKEGLARGNKKVVDDMTGSMLQSFGDNVRRTMGQ